MAPISGRLADRGHGRLVAPAGFVLLVLSWVRSQGYLKKTVSMEHYHLMGKLLLAFTIFWAYIGYDQFFLIWYANITEETRFFLLRNTEGWYAAFDIKPGDKYYLTPDKRVPVW